MANYHFREKGMSLKAKGLLSFMLSLPEDWDYTMAGLAICHKDGLDSVRSAMKELQDYGYVSVSRVRNEKGQLAEADYVIRENPIAEKPAWGNPTQEKHTQINTNINNILNELNTNSMGETPKPPKMRKRKQFVPPTPAEVQAYIKEKNLHVDAKVFFDYFTEGGWVDSRGNKVLNWKQKLLTWNRQQNGTQNNVSSERKEPVNNFWDRQFKFD